MVASKSNDALENLSKAMAAMMTEIDSSNISKASKQKSVKECIHLLKQGTEQTVQGLAKVYESTDKLAGQVQKQNKIQLSLQNKHHEIQKKQLKHQSLTWALDNVSGDLCNSFKYYNDQQECLDISKLLKTILLSFRKGSGHYIDNRVLEKDYHRSVGNFNEVDCEIFRKSVAFEIETLIGMKPLLRKYEGRNAIFFPED
mmetsp:Transcript_10922/g.21624  ORF Transcript_10922/g.21624 Transcript_10922/m.21624 type:complete len:200 (+) Transcript_10922:69-668(+)|eukprot:CAMPEP_0194326696 /NCGR_PEP_ID=MMETSP0171-20130528/37963_1 /TAXON_ID=218684 /ORGANISM="Corethron pennatum, Strain L29A3" /LENGTH=199 /DNA_ID=CAMNT_0039086389 /DNA_START=33 /DNA_END=632 /DNA_ORIENTATION=-